MKNIFENIASFKKYEPTYPTFNLFTEDLNLTTTQDILDFLKKSGLKQLQLAEMQSKNTEKQFRNTQKLTALALLFAFISIIPVISQFVPTNQTKKISENKYELENKLLLQSNTILENQVKILKAQNDIISKSLKNK
jgi:sulfatase maturation enzyme AslB (radical SAM superfamily)